MAARNRPRAGHIKDDLDEERHIWNTILAHVKKLRAINSRAAEVSKQIVAAEKEISLDSGTVKLFTFASSAGDMSKMTHEDEAPGGNHKYLFLQMEALHVVAYH